MTKLFSTQDRYLTHISTDKPIYKLGDTIYFRFVIINGLTQKTISKKRKFNTQIKILGPKGDTITTLSPSKVKYSTISAYWKIPEETSGGVYKIQFSSTTFGFPSSERKI